MRDHLWHLLGQSQSKLAAVRSEFSDASRNYNELKQSSLSAVVRWEWSSSLPRYELEPLYFLNDSARRGKTAKKEPSSIRDKHQYGFDATGRVVAARQHVEFPGQFYEEFLVYGNSQVSSFLYHHSPSKQPINCAQLSLTEGIPTSYHRQGQYGHQSHVYVPEAGKIRYFCSLYSQGGREPFGGCGEVIFTEPDGVELWHFLEGSSRRLSFSGKQSCYNTLMAAISEEENRGHPLADPCQVSNKNPGSPAA